MSLTAAGINYMAAAAIGTGTILNSSNARIGVGNGSQAFSASQTDLQGASKVRKSMDGGYPVVDGATVTFKATFAPDEANFSWNEWGVFNAATGGTMLNRVVESNGTKQVNQTWTLEVSITFAVGA